MRVIFSISIFGCLKKQIFGNIIIGAKVLYIATYLVDTFTLKVVQNHLHLYFTNKQIPMVRILYSIPPKSCFPSYSHRDHCSVWYHDRTHPSHNSSRSMVVTCETSHISAQRIALRTNR